MGLDREKNIEESKKAAAARKREKKKQKGGKDDGGSGDAKGMLDDDDECDIDGKEDGEALTGTEDEKEKTPEILVESTMQLEQASKNIGKNMIGISSNNNEGDSGIDANSRGSSASREEKMEQNHNLQNNKDICNKEVKDQTAKKNKNKNKKGKTIKESSSRERERNEKNAGSSVSTSEHEPTPPPLPNTSASQQFKLSSNIS